MEVRYGLLWSDGLVTKRRPDSTGNGKVWPLNRKCSLKPIEQKVLTVLRSSHTMLSLAYGRYDTKTLVRVQPATRFPTDRLRGAPARARAPRRRAQTPPARSTRSRCSGSRAAC